MQATEQGLCFPRIDASDEDHTLGRLINDNDGQPNAKMKPMTVDGSTHLCLFAIEDIEIGQEIVYSYGSSKECSFPWRTQHAQHAKVSVTPMATLTILPFLFVTSISRLLLISFKDYLES